MNNKNKPFISIIMAVYNNERYFPIAVNSIINQTFTDWELVIVDDGSTDRTPQIADNFANQDSRIKVIHQENQWIFRSYNNGYAAASGKYVFIVNSDDTINPESLQRIHDVAEIDDADIIMFNLNMIKCDLEQNIIENDMYNKAHILTSDFSYNDINQVHAEWSNFIKMRLLSRQCVYKANIAKKHLYRTDFFSSDVFYNFQIANDIKVAAGTSYIVYNFYEYTSISMNASKGKYYGYEYRMNNELYTKYRNLFDSWNVLSQQSLNVLLSYRMNQLTRDIRAYGSDNCLLNINEKLDRIFGEVFDGFVYERAIELNRKEEYESRILSGLREIFIKEIPSENCKYYFFYELLYKLLAYEKDDEDMEIIRKAVYNPLNLHNIGECFYKKLIGG